MLCNKFIKRIGAVILLASVMVVSSGCSDFLKGIAIEKVEDYVNATFTTALSDPENAFVSNSQKEISLEEMIDEQAAIYNYGVKDAVFSIDSVSMNDKRTEAEVKVTFSKVKVLNGDMVIGTVEDFESAIDSTSKSKFTFTFKVIRTETDGWICDDLSDIVSALYNPYVNTCILDEEGNPLNLNEAYISTIFVDFAWYDDITGNPVTNRDTNDDAYSLTAVFYFNQPLSLDLTAELYCDDELCQTIDVVMDNSVVANCSFDTEIIGEPFEAGEYYIVLSMNGMELARTFETEVN